MDYVTPLNEVMDTQRAALDLRRLLLLQENVDIKNDFPATVKRYSESPERAIESIEDAYRTYDRGKKEQFIVYSGGVAVGMSIATNLIEAPEGVDPAWPNLSGFICKPYRQRGLGKLSLQIRLQAVTESFDGHAWTLVREGNEPSERLVLGQGFVKTSTVLGDRALYLWRE